MADNNCWIKVKGSAFKCTDCTATFEIVACDNGTELNYCPTCGGKNVNPDTRNIFGAND